MFTSLTHWLAQHTWLLGTVAAVSFALLMASMLATPWIVAQLPADYLLRSESRSPKHPMLKFTITLLRTLFGATLIVLGFVMLVLPGPGIVTLLIGLSVAQFPGKVRLLRHIASRDSVFDSLNWMRRRHGRAPLIHPSHRDN